MGRVATTAGSWMTASAVDVAYGIPQVVSVVSLVGDHGTGLEAVQQFVAARDVLGGFLAVLAADSDLEWLMIDSTVVRAHQHAAGARRQGGPEPRGWAALAAA